MKTIDESVEKANTATIEGRQIVANACREFYKEIEEDVHKVGRLDAGRFIQRFVRRKFFRTISLRDEKANTGYMCGHIQRKNFAKIIKKPASQKPRQAPKARAFKK